MIKTLLKSVREYKKASILSPLFVTGEVVLEVIIPLLMSLLIDNGINKNDTGFLWKIGLLLAVLSMFSLLFGAMSGKYAAIASAGFAKNLRKDMYYNVQNYSFHNIDKFSTASIVTRLTTDITNLQNSYQMIIRIAVRGPAMLIFSLIMAFFINAKLALIFLVVIPILGIGLYIIMTKAHPIFERVFKTYDRLNNVVQENLHGIRVVKSYVREDHEIQKFEGVSQVIYKDFSMAEKILAANAPLMQFCVYGSMLVISWLSAHFIVGGEMTTGQLSSMISYTMQMLMSLMMLSMVFVMIIISRASAERVVEILNEETDIHNNEAPVFEVPNGDIEFKDVNFSYAKSMDKLCLKDINLKIKSGQTIGIIGGTGSSKSSLVQLIPRLYDATSGTVTVGGLNVENYDLDTLRGAVAMVLQKNVLFSGTISDNIRWGDENASEAEVQRVCKLAQADEFIATFPDGYNTYIEQGGTNVSGGQKQRLCIARALLKKPKILILDDSTSAVDTRTDALIRQAFREEIPNTTKIIIAQRIASIEDADQIIVMEGGRIQDIGNHESLLKRNQIYQEVYYSQIKGGQSEHE